MFFTREPSRNCAVRSKILSLRREKITGMDSTIKDSFLAVSKVVCFETAFVFASGCS